MKSPKKKEVGVGRVAFKARFDAIKEMVDAGYTTAAIHRKYGSQLGIKYTQLNNYINKFIKGKGAVNKTEEKQIVSVPTKASEERGADETDSIVEWKENPDIPDEDLF